jgi:hypothetical protein
VTGQIIEMPSPTAHVKALAALFRGISTWAGTMSPGALGPGSPQLPTSGSVDSSEITDGFWYTCDIISTAGTGPDALTWKGHLVVGWDANASGYRALLVDNIGMWVPLRAELVGTVFVATSQAPLPLMGHLTSARFTWDFSDPDQIRFTNEHQVDGGPWQVWEQEIITSKQP